MLRFWRTSLVAGGVFLIAHGVLAQLPGAPAAPGTGGAGASAAAAAGAAGAAPKGFFARMCDTVKECKRKICATPAGALLNNATKPLTAMTGGIIPPFCPELPSADDLQKPGVAGAADAIKKDALEAKMRRDKVRYLGTVDCRYYPDAVNALVAALRTDGSECVRYEAALALGRGCCCNEKTIKALDYTVSGSDKDGNPAERSVRVRCAAAVALERCLSCYVPPPVEVEPDKSGNIEGGPESRGKSSDDTAAPKKLPEVMNQKPSTLPPESRMPSKATVEAAWRTLNEFHALLMASQPHVQNALGNRTSVYHILKASLSSPQEGEFSGQAAASAGTPSAMPVSSHPAPARSTLAAPTAEPSIRTPSPAAAVSTRPISADRNIVEPQLAAPVGQSVSATPPPTPASSAPVMSAAATQSANATQANLIAPVIAQMLHGVTPAERHAAIRQLVRFDWQKNPVVMSALVAGAKADPVAVVRVDCIRHLAAYQMAHPQVLAELTAITQDSNPWVRDEAAKALSQLKQTP